MSLLAQKRISEALVVSTAIAEQAQFMGTRLYCQFRIAACTRRRVLRNAPSTQAITLLRVL